MKQCGCEYGEDCTRTSVCANNAQVEDLEEKIEQLEGDLQIMRLQRDAKLVSETPTSNALKQEIERLEAEKANIVNAYHEREMVNLKRIALLEEVVEAARQWQRDGRSNSAGDLLCDLLAKLDRGDK